MKLVSIHQRATQLALLLTLALGLAVPGALAQQGGKPQTRTVNATVPPKGATAAPLKVGKPTPFFTTPLFKPGTPQGAVPSRLHPMVGDGTFLPPDVPVRSTEGVTGFDKANAAAKSRVRIGGLNGANVIEKVVNISRTDTIDERTPFWSPDETVIYAAGKITVDQQRYGLLYTSAVEPSTPAAPAPIALTDPADTTNDYLFPVVNSNGNRIAFVRSSDGKGIDDPTKVWNLYVSDLPQPGQFINTAPLGNTNLQSLTQGRDFPDGNGGRVAITNVGRPAWVSANDIVFSAELSGQPGVQHLFSVNVQSRTLFQLTAGPADERNAAISPDGRYIAFDSNSQALTTGESYVSAGDDPNRRLRSETDPSATPTAGQNPGAVRNIFTMDILGRFVRQFTGRYAGAPAVNSVEPAFSSSQNNSFTNPAGNNFMLAFSSDRIPTFANNDPNQTRVTGWTTGPANTSSIYYAFFSRDRGATRLTEAVPTDLNNIGSDGARRLDTANATLVNGSLNDVTKPLFKDRYPTWAPAIKVFRIGFQSNRNGNFFANGFGTGFTPTPLNLNNTFIASLIDITAPTLVRYDTSNPTGEVIHINAVTDPKQPFNPALSASVRSRDQGITPGALLHFTVRLEDREAGLRAENDPAGGAVYLQFKNPNSKYQSQAQGGLGVEHKEFGLGTSFVFTENNGVPLPLANNTSGFISGPEFECQAISAAGAINTFPSDSANGTVYYSHIGNNRGNGPLYLAGIQDNRAYSGVGLPPLDGRNGTQNVWLKLSPLVQLNSDGTPKLDGNGNTIPVTPPDNAGGVLYGATWQVPAEASDWYIDVIAYDAAVNPFNPAQRFNAIIYDNVWGFSTAAPLSGQETDVLVVMDYPLGQKFFSSRFGSQTLPTANVNNLLPIDFGAESYYTDVDASLVISNQGGAAPPAPGSTTARAWDTFGPFNNSQPNAHGAAGGVERQSQPNVLGVESYSDEFLDPGSVIAEPVGGFKLPITGRYNIWRVLSRGAVPGSVLSDYLPKVVTAPADVVKGEDPTKGRTVLHSTRYVVWASPFSGDQFVGAGTITDIQTQNDLTNFVQSGGRLFISGQDIAFALAGSGQSNPFFQNVLKARYVGDNAGEFFGFNAAGTTIANNYIGQLRQDPWNPAGAARVAFGKVTPPGPPLFTYTPLNVTSAATVHIPFVNADPAGTNSIGDASWTAFANGGGSNDIIQANPDMTPAGLPANTPPDATDEFLYNTTPGQPTIAGPGVAPPTGNWWSAIITASYPVGTSAVGVFPAYDQSKPFVKQGKVVYSSAGFESVSQGWYTYTLNQTTFIATYGRRSELMFAVSDLFRTATIIGKVIDDNGSPVNDALVRAVPNVADDTQVASGTALTDAGGNFQIQGLQPGFYVLYGYKAGFYTQHNLGNTVHGGFRSSANVALKRASPGSLTGIRNTTNNTYGGVFSSDGVTPVPGIEVQVRRLEVDGRWTLVTAFSSDGVTPITLPDGTVTSLPLGAYSFPTLAIANYQVYANARTTVVNGQIVPKTRDANGKLPGVNEAYGEVRVLIPPQPEVRLGAGTQVVDDKAVGPAVRILEGQTAMVDFLLPTAPQKVVGQVVDQDTNQPIAGAVVTATLQGTSTVVASGVTDANGNYTLSVVSPVNGQDPTLIPGGNYVIVATVNGYSTASPPSEANGMVIKVGGSLDPTVTVQQIRLKKLPPGSVSGLVKRLNGVSSTTSGVAGATVTLYAVTTVNGTQQQATDPSYTATVAEPPTTASDGYVFNYSIPSVSPGTYNAYVSKPGLTGDPSPFANVVVTSGTETRNVNFQLQPPKIYGEGVQLISVPVDFSNIPTPQVFGLTPNGDNNGDGNVNSIDQQIFSTFNIADWTGTAYDISPNIPLRLGKGYFARFGAVATVVGVGTPTQTDTYTINLSAAWNLIGHPFADRNNPSNPAADIDITAPTLATYSYTTTDGQQRVNVPLSQAVADNAMQAVVYSYTGSNAGSQYIQGALLKPWFGYWIRAFVPVQMTLHYPGSGTRAVPTASGKGGAVFRSVTTAEREAPVFRSIESKALNDWRIQIAAQQGNLRDTDNSVGVAPDAKEGFDNRYDNEKPPLVSQMPGVYVAVQGTSTTGRAADFADNIKTADGQAKTWRFTVQSNAGNGEVTVYWPNIARLPRGLEPMLVDEATGQRVPMRSTSSFHFTPSGKAQRSFRVEVAPPSSLPLDIINLRTAPPSRSLRGTTYRFTFMATRAVDVNAEVKTLTGRSVKHFQMRAAAGADTNIAWDGRSDQGSAIPPGPYILSISAVDGNGARVTRSVPFITMQ